MDVCADIEINEEGQFSPCLQELHCHCQMGEA